MPLSKAHRQAISKGVKAYHARCRACKDEDNTPLDQLQMYKKKKKRKKKKAAPKPKPVPKKRRVALVAVARPALSTAFGTGMPAFTGLKTYHSALGAIESKYGGAADLAPDLGFSI